MTDLIIAQVPPTPTFMPQAFSDGSQPPLAFPDMGIWTFADDAVGMWNQYPQVSTPLQAIVILMLVITGILLFRKLVNSLNRNDSSTEGD